MVRLLMRLTGGRGGAGEASPGRLLRGGWRFLPPTSPPELLEIAIDDTPSPRSSPPSSAPTSPPWLGARLGELV